MRPLQKYKVLITKEDGSQIASEVLAVSKLNALGVVRWLYDSRLLRSQVLIKKVKGGIKL